MKLASYSNKHQRSNLLFKKREKQAQIFVIYLFFHILVQAFFPEAPAVLKALWFLRREREKD